MEVNFSLHRFYSANNESRQKEAISNIKKCIAENIGEEVLPKYYEFDEELLYTSNGKIDFEKMQKGI